MTEGLRDRPEELKVILALGFYRIELNLYNQGLFMSWLNTFSWQQQQNSAQAQIGRPLSGFYFPHWSLQGPETASKAAVNQLKSSRNGNLKQTEKEKAAGGGGGGGEAKAQHPQTYGCPLLDYTSAGWKITSSLSVCVCVLHMLMCVSKSSNWSLLKITRYHLTCVFEN